jgi:hypothetical protein
VRSIYLLAEGQTEYEVVDTVIQPHLEAVGFHVRKTVLVTRPAAAGDPARRGGVSRWGKLEGEIRRILRDPTIDLMTTMIDYYGLPADVPGMAGRPNAVADLGLDELRKACPHADAWLRRLESLA